LQDHQHRCTTVTPPFQLFLTALLIVLDAWLLWFWWMP